MIGANLNSLRSCSRRNGTRDRHRDCMSRRRVERRSLSGERRLSHRVVTKKPAHEDSARGDPPCPAVRGQCRVEGPLSSVLRRLAEDTLSPDPVVAWFGPGKQSLPPPGDSPAPNRLSAASWHTVSIAACRSHIHHFRIVQLRSLFLDAFVMIIAPRKYPSCSIPRCLPCFCILHLLPAVPRTCGPDNSTAVTTITGEGNWGDGFDLQSGDAVSQAMCDRRKAGLPDGVEAAGQAFCCGTVSMCGRMPAVGFLSGAIMRGSVVQ